AHAEIDKLLGKGRVSPDKANRLKSLITGSLGKEAFAGADFVIEAVFEEMSVKKTMFAEVEEHVSPECVLATNTSSLSVSEMASELRHPERVRSEERRVGKEGRSRWWAKRRKLQEG